ncbi:aromatic ring-hydroxylating oxygenase subunit alpha [Chromobacterium haemolyticum]|uniref:aromatic ring-hydroxylating oxygenase subunit alpha n=1 Tax=Chromobacterium haemolyticum TaxID=394935 RepID=UPI0009DAF115|nr:aromatic ring-hydroxylating dioxygenase subunit alpha [Chromobacterium haemolyticum]OQS32555.1 Rieske (2Fe-2S) protein [Chromobacterium haemolyticum]PTU69063.1 aromatic ring-hydroxylating dioxygenase subunit alpha [Chromobacterium haemolyticum]
MSDLASAQMLQASAAQLPVYTYFDPAYYAQEQRLLFGDAPIYYGHELMTPNAGDYQTLEWMGHGKMLKNVDGRIKLISNVCRHRQAIIYKGRGNGNHIVCNLHGWTYDAEGSLLGAPHFPETPCLNLSQTELTRWNGLLFDARRNVARDLENLGVAKHMSFDGYAYHSSHLTEYAFNWKTFIEVYSEDYHVDPFHPGLGNFVDCDDLKWEWGAQYHVQTVGVKNQLATSGSRVYGKWHEEVRRRYADQQPEFGAIWLTYYPNIMVEWYPHVLVVSVVMPRGPEQCTVLTEFYYPEDVVWFEPEFIEAEQAAYFETAKEDDEICYRMHEGRRALWMRGESEVGPYQSPTEEGMLHFHEFYRRKMGEALTG